MDSKLLVYENTAVYRVFILKQTKTGGAGMGSLAYAEAAATGEASGSLSANLLYLAIVSMLAGELIGRYLYYATGVQIMIGG